MSTKKEYAKAPMLLIIVLFMVDAAAILTHSMWVRRQCHCAPEDDGTVRAGGVATLYRDQEACAQVLCAGTITNLECKRGVVSFNVGHPQACPLAVITRSGEHSFEYANSFLQYGQKFSIEVEQ